MNLFFKILYNLIKVIYYNNSITQKNTGISSNFYLQQLNQ